MSELEKKLREAAHTTPDREIAAPLLLDAAEAIKRWRERYESYARYCPGELHVFIEGNAECQRCGYEREAV